MPAPLNVELLRVNSGSQLSSSSSSIVTIRPADAMNSSAAPRRGISPANAANTPIGPPSIQQPINFSGTYPPRQLPSKNVLNSGGAAGDPRMHVQDNRSASSLPNTSTSAPKRHISFSKRFSFSSGPNGSHAESGQGSNVGNARDVGHSTKSRKSTENMELRRAEASLRSNWTPASSHVDQATSSIAGPSRLITKSPETLAEQRRSPYSHDPYDYRGNFVKKEEAKYISVDPAAPQETADIRRASSRRKRHDHPGYSEERTPVRLTNGDTPHADLQASTNQDSQGLSTSSTTGRNVGQKDKKSMLSRALQRANAAVAMDNAQDYVGAKEAYEEACEYLGRVMSRSSNEEDKRRLTGIRATYTARIEELQQLGSRVSMRSDQSSDSASRTSSHHASFDGLSDDQTITQSMQPAVKIKLIGNERHHQSDNESMKDQFAYSTTEHDASSSEPDVMRLQMGRMDPRRNSPDSSSSVAQLTPNGLFTPSASRNISEGERFKPEGLSTPKDLWSASRTESQKSVKTITDPELDRRPSQASSNHSLTSVNGIRRKHLRVGSGETEAEFDAALDAAVEAVYDEGYEPYNNASPHVNAQHDLNATSYGHPIHGYNAFAETEGAVLTARKHSPAQLSLPSQDSFSELESETESDEEERMLDAAIMGTSQILNEQAKPILPRQSDSSGSSGRTWASSDASTLSTVVTPLSPVNETVPSPSTFAQLRSRHLPPPTPPPTSALPRLPTTANVPNSYLYQQHPGIQDRRSSGQRVKRLQIKTPDPMRFGPLPSQSGDLSSHSDQIQAGSSSLSTTPNTSMRYESKTTDDGQARPVASINERNQPPLSPGQTTPGALLSSNASNFSPSLSTISSTPFSPGNIGASPDSASPDSSLNRSNSQRPPFGKSFSSTSLMTKVRPGIHADTMEASPDTPVSFGFIPISPPHRMAPSAGSVAATSPPPIPHVNKVQLFANEMHLASSPSSPSSRILHPPRPLEPCPESSLLRPFWLLRCIYQTLTHPRGGYITNKLFIPREVWRTKNNKIRAMEDKVAACDMLTAALLKLGTVNTLDADAVHDEFQSLETVMDQVQSSLTKKLGSDVGPHSISSLFKDAPPSVSSTPGDKSDLAAQSFNNDAVSNVTSTGSFGKASGKSSFNLSSWRKLRSKNSSNSLSTSFSSVKDAPREPSTMASLPMAGSSTEEPVFRGNRRSMLARPVVGAADAMKMEGPNANYMAALARLCEAVQILDQIARQVEDPGLKLSSPTHVGLEFSARHAAEFFGFYICRFVLQDVTLLAEKFIKRASEWVML